MQDVGQVSSIVNGVSIVMLTEMLIEAIDGHSVIDALSTYDP